MGDFRTADPRLSPSGSRGRTFQGRSAERTTSLLANLPEGTHKPLWSVRLAAVGYLSPDYRTSMTGPTRLVALPIWTVTGIWWPGVISDGICTLICMTPATVPGAPPTY